MNAGAVPPLFDHLGDFERRLSGVPAALFLDFDGTLAPIVDEPAAAELSSRMRQTLVRVAAQITVAVVSGRDRADVAGRVGIEHIFYAGSHGLDIAGPGGAYEHEEAVKALPSLDRVERELRAALASVPGALLERKRFAISAHHRKSPPGEAEKVRAAVEEAVNHQSELTITGGKSIVEVRPSVDWDKGDAVEWLLAVLGLREGEVVPVYVGDDLTDEDAFRALRDREHGVGLLVGDPVELDPTRQTLADYHLRDLAEVERFLRHFSR